MNTCKGRNPMHLFQMFLLIEIVGKEQDEREGEEVECLD